MARDHLIFILPTERLFNQRLDKGTVSDNLDFIDDKALLELAILVRRELADGRLKALGIETCPLTYIESALISNDYSSLIFHLSPEEQEVATLKSLNLIYNFYVSFCDLLSDVLPETTSPSPDVKLMKWLGNDIVLEITPS